jgi:hypothetical protein
MLAVGRTSRSRPFPVAHHRLKAYGISPDQVVGTIRIVHHNHAPRDFACPCTSGVVACSHSASERRYCAAALSRSRVGKGRALLHHDDARREVAYDRDLNLSQLAEAVDMRPNCDITIVRLTCGGKTVFGTETHEARAKRRR